MSLEWTKTSIMDPPSTPPPTYDDGQRMFNESITTEVKLPAEMRKVAEISSDRSGSSGRQQALGAASSGKVTSGEPDNNKSESRVKLLSSLAAPKKLLNHVGIEPLTFLAILSMYIEFPSIQDLIYTKVCLQVVSTHPNLTGLYVSPPLVSTSNLSNLSSFLKNDRPFPIQLNVSSPLPLNGRIIQTDIDPNSIKLQPIYSIHRPSDHQLCNRLNKTAVPQELRKEISHLDSQFWLKYQIVICLLCALSSPYWGGMSDRLGRLIPLNIPIVMSTLSNLISLGFGLLISMNSHHLFNLEWLYLGAFLVGISGGQAIVIVTSFSFISDNSTSESRSKRITILETIIYLSHGVGFYLNKHIMSLGLAPIERAWLNRHFVAFAFCILLNLICNLYSLVKLRHHKFHRFLNNFEREQQEATAGDMYASPGSSHISGSLNRMDSSGAPVISKSSHEAALSSGSDRRRELTSSTPDDVDGPIAKADKRFTSWGVILTLKYYQQTWQTIVAKRESRAVIWSLLFCGFISGTCLACFMSLLYIYLRMDPFNWTTSQYSSWNSISSISKGSALIGLTLCMKFVKSWNVPDPLVAALGFLSKGIGLTMIGLAYSTTVIDWAPLALVLSEFAMPPMRSLLSKLVIHEEVGKIYSCLAAIQNMCFLLGNVVFYMVYNSVNSQDFFRASFLVVAALQFGAVLIMLSIYHHLRKRFIII